MGLPVAAEELRAPKGGWNGWSFDRPCRTENFSSCLRGSARASLPVQGCGWCQCQRHSSHMKRGPTSYNTTKTPHEKKSKAITYEKSTIKTIIHHLPLPRSIDPPLGPGRYVQQQIQNPHAGAAYKQHSVHRNMTRKSSRTANSKQAQGYKRTRWPRWKYEHGPRTGPPFRVRSPRSTEIALPQRTKNKGVVYTSRVGSRNPPLEIMPSHRHQPRLSMACRWAASVR